MTGSHHFPGAYANLSSPSADDAIHAAQNVPGTPGGTGMLNTLNPSGAGAPNNNAINAAFGGNTDPSTAQTSPGYIPPASLVKSEQDYVAWWTTNHPPKHGAHPTKGHRDSDR